MWHRQYTCMCIHGHLHVSHSEAWKLVTCYLLRWLPKVYFNSILCTCMLFRPKLGILFHVIMTCLNNFQQNNLFLSENNYHWWLCLADTDRLKLMYAVLFNNLYYINFFVPVCFRGCGFTAVVLEAPCCCPFLDFIDKIGSFSESRPYWQKAALYMM